MTAHSQTQPYPMLPAALGSGALPAMVWLRWLAQAKHHTLGLDHWFDGTAGLPDLLELAQIDRLVVPKRAAGWPRNWRWQAVSGYRVQVGTSPRGHRGGPSHRGPVLADDNAPAAPASVVAMTELARMEDATAAVSNGSGASWDHLLAALDQSDIKSPAAVAGRHTASHATSVWNPCARRRVAVAALPSQGQTPPWGLRDQQGRHYPIQVTEGPLGTEWLTVLELDALESRQLIPYDDPVSGAHWEVTPRVLDNGLVRAEFDEHGFINKLCFDGGFLPQRGPLPLPIIDGVPFDGQQRVTVLEDGPVRGRLQIVHECGYGLLTITCTLIAQRSDLQISATWHGDKSRQPALLLPTAYTTAPVTIGWEIGGCTVPQTRSLEQPARTWHGLRHLSLGGDSWHPGLGVALRRATAVHIDDGSVTIPIEHLVDVTLCDNRSTQTAAHSHTSLGQIAVDGWLPHRSSSHMNSPPFRLHAEGDTCVHWVRLLADGRRELLVSSCSDQEARMWIFPHGDDAHDAGKLTAHSVDVHGETLAQLPTVHDGSAFRVDLPAWSVRLVAW